MSDILDFQALSDHATIGKILVLASIVLTAVELCILAVITMFLVFTQWFGILVLALLVITIIGFVLNCLHWAGYRKTNYGKPASSPSLDHSLHPWILSRLEEDFSA